MPPLLVVEGNEALETMDCSNELVGTEIHHLYTSVMARRNFAMDLIISVSHVPRSCLSQLLLTVYEFIGVDLAGANGPYSNHLGIAVTFELESGGGPAFNEFICDLIIEGLGVLTMAVAPELAPEEFLTDEELLTICNSALENSS